MGQLTENEGSGHVMSADLVSHDQAATADDRDFIGSRFHEHNTLPDLLQDLTPQPPVVEEVCSPAVPTTRSVSCQVECPRIDDAHRHHHRRRRRRSKEKSSKPSGVLFKQELSTEDIGKARKMKNLASQINVPKMDSTEDMVSRMVKQNMWMVENTSTLPSSTKGIQWGEVNNNEALFRSPGSRLVGGKIHEDNTPTFATKGKAWLDSSLEAKTLRLSPVVISTVTQNDPTIVGQKLRPVKSKAEEQKSSKTKDITSDYPEIIGNYTQAASYDESLDEVCHSRAFSLLYTSGCYYGRLSMQEARQKLRRSAVGTYLLRDSSDSRYFLALSVKTQRGTTAIRLSYSRGRFRLDCEESAVLKMPSFDCVMKLIQYYNAAVAKTKNQNCVFLESTGRKDTPVVLQKPYLESPHTLKHMCRLTLNRVLTDEQRQRLLIFESPDIEEYLLEYPYFV